MKSIGELLREQRESKQLLLREVAAALAMDTALLSKIERDERKPNKEQVLSFANYYKVKPDDFLVALFSDKVVNDIVDEDRPSLILKAAEGKLETLKKKNKQLKKR